MASLLSANRLLVESAREVRLLRRTLGELRGETREVALRLAREQTAAMRDAGRAADEPSGPLFVTGHQPELFHPGVWAKNIAISALAQAHGGTGLNLVVDSDLCDRAMLSVPRGPRDAPVLEAVPFLESQSPRPWEELDIADSSVFRSAGNRIAALIYDDWGFVPVIDDVWKSMAESESSSLRLGELFTRMRSRYEQALGVQNLELSLSRLTETEPFRWFVAHVLAHAEEFRRVHNRVLTKYREEHQIRSHLHPVPELTARDGWVESPFWVWRAGEQRRSPLLCRAAGSRFELGRDGGPLGKIRVHREGGGEEAVEDLETLAREGWKIRSRALTTTMFARLFLADLFVHGIGGAKYDEVTDRIIEQFFACAPPPFLALTATLHLPIAPFAVREVDRRKLAHRQRELRFHGERMLAAPELAEIAERKRALVASYWRERAVRQAPAVWRRGRAERRARDLEFRRLQQEIETVVHPALVETQRELAALDSQLAANRILQSREYAWCLFPAEALREFAQRVREYVTGGGYDRS
jgi:hypothetical protein